ncbi:glycosyltransferase [Pelagibacteraceae bacterium]|nr:glycosyltransferase [Pelagibacteraceae bacterium]
MKNNTLVFTATFNESENIKNFLNIALKVKDIDILIIDDNSPDGTANLIQEYKKNHENLNLIVRDKKEGLDTAHKLAYKYAKENGYKKFISMDADLSHDPSKIPIFIEELDFNPFVIGSRYIKGGRNETKLIRYLLSVFGNKIIKIVLNIDCEEFTTSYRGFNIIGLSNFDINKVNSQGYSFFMETIYRVHKSGYSIKQVPIIFADRTKGISKIPKIETLRTLKNLFLIKINKL